MVAVKLKLVGQFNAFCNPEAGVVGVDFLSYRFPFFHTETVVLPEKDNRFAVKAKIGGVLGVGVKQIF